MAKSDSAIRASAAAAASGRFAEAASMLEELLREEPRNSSALEQLGIVSFQRGDAKRAVQCLQMAAELAPGNEFAWNNLGVVLEATGEFAQATESYRRAIAVNPQRAALHFNLGNTLRSLGQIAEAEESFRRCLRLDSTHAQALHNLGVLRKEAGDAAEAERLLRSAVNLAPEIADAQVNLGSVLQTLGRDEEALQCYRNALATIPNYPDAIAGECSVLDHLGREEEARQRIQPAFEAHAENPDVATTFATLAKTVEEREKAVAALKQLTREESLPPKKREAALFALGKLSDALGLFPEAFQFYSEANSVQPHPFSLDEYRGMNRRICEVFSAAGMKQFPRAANRSSVPVFVVGMPRSGTSLVEQILASHPQVFGAGELTWVHDLTLAWPDRLGSGDSYPQCAFDFSARALDAAAEEYLAHLRSLGGEALRVIDKMPGNFTHLGMIELLFPAARIIHVSREPADNCLSCFFQNFSSGHDYASDLSTLGAVYRDYDSMMAHWRATLTLPMLELRYETLVENQEAESRRLVEFCGLPWDEQCLRFHETDRRVRTASYDQVRQPMYRASLSRHRHYEAFLGPLREGLGG